MKLTFSNKSAVAGIAVLFVAVALPGVPAYAPPAAVHPGDLDAKFNPCRDGQTKYCDGVVVTTGVRGLETGAGQANAVGVQPDGKIVVAGSRFTVNRYNPDGTLDPQFGSGGRATVPFPEFGSSDTRFGTAKDLAIQPDGKIVVAGEVPFPSSANSTVASSRDPNYYDEAFALARYNPDGSLDGSFNPCDGPAPGQACDGRLVTPFGKDSSADGVALQPDGKIVAAGVASPVDPYGSDFALARYNSDGSLDTGFNQCPSRPALPADPPCGGRLTTNFTPLVGQAAGGHLTVAAHDVAIYSDGKILAAGELQYQGAALARYNPNGSPDSSFNPCPPPAESTSVSDICGGKLGKQSGYWVQSLAIQNDRKIVLGGERRGNDPTGFTVARLDENGSDDTLFNPCGPGVAQPCGGQRYTSFGFTRCANPPVKPCWKQGLPSGRASGVAVDPEGKIVAAGYVKVPTDVPLRQGGTSYNSAALARYNSDGTADPGFNPCAANPAPCGGVVVSDFSGNAAKSNWSFAAVALQPQAQGGGAKIVAAGPAMARYNSDGTADTSFGKGGVVVPAISSGPIPQWGAAGNTAKAMAIQPDGKIVVVGHVSSYPQHDLAVMRYNPDATLDKSFGEDGISRRDFGWRYLEPNALALQPDGKIVVGGHNSTFAVAFELARFNPDGTLDDGSPSDSTPGDRFGRDGIVRSTIGAAAEGSIYDLAIQPDGKIVAVGHAGKPAVTGPADKTVGQAAPSGPVADLTFRRFYTPEADEYGEHVPGKTQGSLSNGGRDVAVARYLPDGKLDYGFAPCRPGETTWDRFPCGGWARLSFDGSDTRPDNVYDNQPFPSVAEGKGVALQPDGKIVVVGGAKAPGYRESTGLAMARLDSGGTLDKSFNPCGSSTPPPNCDGKVLTPNGAAYDVAIQPDGMIVAAGGDGASASSTDASGSKSAFTMARHRPDGSLDLNFNPCGVPAQAPCGGRAASSFDVVAAGARQVSVQPDGRIVAAGFSGLFANRLDFAVARYEPCGVLDTSFGQGGKVTTPINNTIGTWYGVTGLGIQQDGNIVAAGGVKTGEGFAVARYLGGGSPVGSDCPKPPGPPVLSAQGADRKVNLSWSPPAAKAGWTLTGYRIYRSTTPGAQTALSGVGDQASYTDNAVQNGVTYYYKVAATYDQLTPAAEVKVQIPVTKTEGPLSNEAAATPTGPAPGVTSPTLSIGDVTVPEPDSGSIPAPFTVSLSRPAPKEIKVDFVTQDGSAKAGQDYRSAKGTLAIPAGKSSGVINVDILGDAKTEPTRTFKVSLSNPKGASVLRPEGTGTILDAKPGLSIGDVTVKAPAQGEVPASFTLVLNGAPTKTVTADYATADGSAAAGKDYVGSTGKVAFAPGEKTKTLTVAVMAQPAPLPTKTFTLKLSNVTNTVVSKPEGTGTILGEELYPNLGAIVRPFAAAFGLPLPATAPVAPVSPVSQVQSVSQAQTVAQAQPVTQAQIQAGAAAERQREAQAEGAGLDDKDRQPQLEPGPAKGASEFMASALRNPAPGAVALVLSWIGGMIAIGSALAKSSAPEPVRARQSEHPARRYGPPGQSDRPGPPGGSHFSHLPLSTGPRRRPGPPR